MKVYLTKYLFSQGIQEVEAKTSFNNPDMISVEVVTRMESLKRKITIADMQREVAGYFKISIAQLKSRNNSRSVVIPRQIAMYLSRQMTKVSLAEIGRRCGGKHHTTVMHSIAKIGQLKDALPLDSIRKALQ